MGRRPALLLALAFGGGIVGQHLWNFPLSLTVIVFLAATLSAFFFCTRARSAAWNIAVDTLLLAAVCGAGMLRTAFEQRVPSGAVSRWAGDEKEILLLGKTLEAPEQRREYWRVAFAVRAMRRSDSIVTNVRGNVLVSGKQLQNLAPGADAILRGRLRLADEERNPGEFDYRMYLRAHDISALFYCSDSLPLWTRPALTRWSLAQLSADTRAWLKKQLPKFSRGQELALLKGLLLGEIEEIDQEIMESFARTGLIHILSVSGLHVGFIALLLMLAASLARIPKRRQWLFIVIALWCYAHLTGLKPPIVRASLMATALLAGRAFERETNLPNNISVAALLILLWHPLQLLQLGFQLSFLAMFGLAYLYKPLLVLFARIIPWRWQPLRWAMALLAASLAAQLATLPIIVTTYGRLPLTAIWGNLMVIPVSFLTVATATLACTCAPFSNFVMQVYGAVADCAAAFMLKFTHWLATLPFAYIEGVRLAPWLIVSYLLLLATFVTWRKSTRRWLLPCALLVLNVHVWNEALGEVPRLRVTFFDVGQGDAAVLEFPQGKRLLIDTGPWRGETNAGASVLVPYFHRQGIRRLHAVVISHPHTDHLGGLPALLSALQIDTVYQCSNTTSSELVQRCARLMDSLHVPYRALHAGEQLHGFSPAAVTALCSSTGDQNPSWRDNLNDASLVIKIIFGKTSLLFPGDVEQLGEAHLLQHTPALDSDLLKVGHHGSRTSSSEVFLRAVTPQWAVISVGRYNRFGHPHAEILERYARLGIHMLRTSQNGAVIFETDGNSLQRTR
ncbi:DNA internalization-related competence protein ComEC/Rec2 [candidate division KSB1 bacterium]|nr:DNA internalization-related competence protein ComEC/Rec2 [candidate division KSB1 bacterium]